MAVNSKSNNHLNLFLASMNAILLKAVSTNALFLLFDGGFFVLAQHLRDGAADNLHLDIVGDFDDENLILDVGHNAEHAARKDHAIAGLDGIQQRPPLLGLALLR